MAKIDLKKELKSLYEPSTRQIVSVDVPAMNFLMIDGVGDPNTAPAYKEAVEALYGVSYTLKFTVKKSPKGTDYTVMPLEGLWWSGNMDDFIRGNKNNWYWTAMIMQPDFITKEMVEKAKEDVAKKKGLTNLGQLRFEKFREGLSAQIMYLGPFADEGPTITMIHEDIAQNDRKLRGKHHEIYLSDPRKTSPEKLKTIIRQPFE
jgi:hypothetical protein